MIAALGTGLADGAELGALAAAYVLLTAVLGPVLTKYAAHLPVPARLRQTPGSVSAQHR